MNEREASVRSTLKLALEALETCGCDEVGYGYNEALTISAITAVKEALAQPEQRNASEHLEPVAWMKDIGHGKYVDMVKPVGGFYGMCIPLYTTPPQCTAAEGEDKKTWVGLTDEEKSDIWYVVTNRYFVTEDTHVYADAIEAKLKAKNFASSEGFKEKNT